MNKPHHIVIVGGGTAGWLAANHLGKQLSGEQSNVTISLIESPNIATIGVGEGTVPMMRQTLQYFGISETDFIRQTNATFKQGIKFVNWLNDPNTVGEHYYHHSFDYPQGIDQGVVQAWLQSDRQQAITDWFGVQGKVCDANLAPKTITTPEYQGLTSYAYHLDAGLFTQILQQNAVEQFSVNHIRADVQQVVLAENGDISALKTEQQGEINGDFFVDCSGFRSLLLGQALQVPFVDKQSILFADKALTVQLPYQDEHQTIASHTISTAVNNGWIWDIGLQTRRGIGHVYSSAHQTEQQAVAQLSQYLGQDAETLSPRLINMKVGHRKQFWQRNCVALGLAQGFVEPLEATGLLIFDVTAKLLADIYPLHPQQIAAAQQQFNQAVLHSWENVIDFIKLHYCISNRTDSQFWLDNRQSNSIPLSLQQKLDTWRYRTPLAYDFASKYDVFNLDNYLYVLYGMEYPTDLSHATARNAHLPDASTWLKHSMQQQQKALHYLPEHRQLIEKIKQYGLQKV